MNVDQIVHTRQFAAKFDQGDGSVHYHYCIRLCRLQVWTVSRFRAAVKRQQFRRSVVNKHLAPEFRPKVEA